MKVYGYIYLLTHGNGKIYIGSDHCCTINSNDRAYKALQRRLQIFSYFGSATNIQRYIDWHEYEKTTGKPFTPKREIIAGPKIWASRKILFSVEQGFILKSHARDPQVGYNL